MDVHLSVSSIIILCFFLTILPPSYCDEDKSFAVCNRTYTCGCVNISYPFWGGGRPEYCGHQGHELSCIDNKYAVIRIEELEFVVLNINPSNRSFTIARWDLLDGPCPPKLLNTTLNYTLFDYTPNDQNVTIVYGCHPQDLECNSIPIPNRFNCNQLGGFPDGKMNAYIVDQSNSSNQLPKLMEECENSIKVPILKSSATALLENPHGGALAVQFAMNQGFEVEYYSNGLAIPCRTCLESGGVCGSNSTRPSQFVCLCGEQSIQVQSSSCHPKPAGMHACSLFSSQILGYIGLVSQTNC